MTWGQTSQINVVQSYVSYEKGDILTTILSRVWLYNRCYSIFDCIDWFCQGYIRTTYLGPSLKNPFYHSVAP
jgi:hypothetical protein